MAASSSSAPMTNSPTVVYSLMPVVVGLVVMVVGLRVHNQGFNLMDDGLWLLGARVLADGGQLYRDLFSIYGPARYVMLLPFFAICGQSIWALAVLKAVLDAVGAGFGFWLTRRLGAGRWAWLVPVAVVALGPVYPRYVAAGVFAAMVAGVIPLGSGRRQSWFLGLAWGVLSLFGLDVWAWGAVVPVGGLLLGDSAMAKDNWFALGLGMVAVLVLVAIGPLLGHYGRVVWWDTVTYPLTRFGGEMGLSWWDIFRSSPQLAAAFSGLNTGEQLAPLWSGHGAWRAVAWRLLFVLAWIAPLVAVWGVRRFSLGRLAPLVALGVASWSTLLGRGDLDHLRLVCWAMVLLVPPLLGHVVTGRRSAGFVVAVCLLVLGPRLSEQLWLAGHVGRPSLACWQNSRARVYLGADRMHDLDVVLQESGATAGSTVVAWPAQPGLVFLMGAKLATPQMTILAGEIRSPETIVADLEANPPEVVLLGRSAGLVAGVRNMRALAPAVYGFLRRNYALRTSLQTPEAVYRVLHYLPGSQEAVHELPLAERLAGDSQFIRTGTTPVMGPGLSVAQTVQITDFDLSGLGLLVGSPGPWPQDIVLNLQIIGVTNGRPDQLLAQVPLQVTLNEQIERIAVPFDPVPGTAGRLVILDIGGNPDGNSPFTLFWHRPDATAGTPVDYYPAGQAFWNQDPVGGDLFFAVY